VTAAKIIVIRRRWDYIPRVVARKFQPQRRVTMSQHFKPILLLAFVLLALTINASAQTKPSAADNEKAEKNRAEIRKWFAMRAAETEQRKAIINDLIDTNLKCIDLVTLHMDAKEGTSQEKSYAAQLDSCYETLWAKIDRTPLNVLTPFSTVTKGTDLQYVKRHAFNRLFEAYEYGTERAKSAATERKP
jgi:hypothetical protein